jgi:glycogen debranching enzyme
MGTGDSVVFSGYTVLCAGRDGSIAGETHGLLHRDARVVSANRLTLDGQVPQLVDSWQPHNNQWAAVLRVPRAGGSADGPQLPQDALELRIDRTVGSGMLEVVSVINHASVKAACELRIELDADFVDSLELMAADKRSGRITKSVRAEPPSLRIESVLEHDGRSSERGVDVVVARASSTARVDETAIAFSLDLAPRGAWNATLRYDVLEDGTWVRPDGVDASARGRQRAGWHRTRPALEGPDAIRLPFERAADDLADLRNVELERELLGSTDGSRWVLNAGMPMFTGLFGRDAITAGWQAAMLGPRALRGALDAVAATAATENDPWRDAEPGKLIHELRSGPLADSLRDMRLLGLQPTLLVRRDGSTNGRAA